MFGTYSDTVVFAASAAASCAAFWLFFALSWVWMPSEAASRTDDRVRLCSYAVSTAHAAVAAAGGAYCFLVDDGGAYSSPALAAFGRSEPRAFFLLVTAGYLAYDLCLVLSFRRALYSHLTVLHHLLIVCAFILGVASSSGTYYMAVFLVNEVSTLPLNANYFMAASPAWRGGVAYRANGVLLLLTYAGFRVAFNFWALYHLVVCTWVPYQPVVWPSLTTAQKVTVSFNTFLAFVHTLINLVWFRDIVVAVRRKLGRQRSRAKAD